MQELGRVLSWKAQKKCHHYGNEVPANECLCPPFFCVSMHHHRDATGSWQPCWGHPWLGTASTSLVPFGPWWPLVLMTEWTFCITAACPGEDKRWWQWKETQSWWRLGDSPMGHGSNWAAEWWVQLRTRGPLSLFFDSACHVVWCFLCLEIKT